MRILLTADPELPVPPLHYGGIERIIDLLIKYLRLQNVTVGLVAHKDSIATCDQFYAWPGLNSNKHLDIIKNSACLLKAVRQFQPDVLHSFSRVVYMLPLIRSKVSKIMSYQRQPTAQTIKWVRKLGFKKLTFTGCSEYITRAGSDSGGVWHPIHNFVDTTKFTFKPYVKPDAPLIFLSRVERVKGAHNAIQIAKRTHRRLIIAGNHSDLGEEGRYWREEILPHLNDKNIVYVGAVDDVQKNKLLGESAAMIVPIEWDEPFGIVFAEALACGTPVISSPRGALPEIIRDGVDGFLVNNFDEACLAVNNISKIDRNCCRKRVEDSFSPDVIVTKYVELYQNIIRGTSV